MLIFYYIFIFLVLIAVIFIFTSILRGFFLGKSKTPWVPLNKKHIRRLLKLADLNENSILYDLGSGDGRVLITAAREFRVGRLRGIEISWFFYWLTKLKIKFFNLTDKITVKRGDFFEEDLSQANVIICYLLTGTLERLKFKFIQELAPGTLILSFIFPIHGWQPIRVDKPSPKSQPIYIYKI